MFGVTFGTFAEFSSSNIVASDVFSSKASKQELVSKVTEETATTELKRKLNHFQIAANVYTSHLLNTSTGPLSKAFENYKPCVRCLAETCKEASHKGKKDKDKVGLNIWSFIFQAFFYIQLMNELSVLVKKLEIAFKTAIPPFLKEQVRVAKALASDHIKLWAVESTKYKMGVMSTLVPSLNTVKFVGYCPNLTHVFLTF